MRKPNLPPPIAFTFGDKMRIAMGALILLFGIVILWRTLPLGVTPQGIVVGIAFIGFGVYRLWLGFTRLKRWKTGK
jgi:hypothetical protein